MAGDYDIARGKKIDFRFDRGKDIYIASCDGKDFGLLKTLLAGTRKDLEKLGPVFGGTAVHVIPGKHDMSVKVFLTGNNSRKIKGGNIHGRP